MKNRKIHFFGRVAPERYPFTMDPPLNFTSEYIDFGFKANLSLSIFTSQINCFVDIEKDEMDIDLSTARNLIKSSIDSVVDLFGYIQGVSYRVEMLSYTGEHGEWHVFGINHEFIQRNFGIFNSIDNNLLSTILRSSAISSIALHDFRMAMENPMLTGLFCYRAIECLMQEATNEITDNNPKKWEKFREITHTTEDEIRRVKAHADDARHGKLKPISGEDREIIITITRNIIDNYIKYLCKPIIININ